MFMIYEGRQIEIPGMEFTVKSIENDIVILVPKTEFEYTIDEKRHFFSATLRIPMKSFNYYQK
jgi:hypothetical protein